MEHSKNIEVEEWYSVQLLTDMDAFGDPYVPLWYGVSFTARYGELNKEGTTQPSFAQGGLWNRPKIKK